MMQYRLARCMLFAMLTSSSFFVAGQTKDALITSASACTDISGRLERLACFDRVFETPLDAAEVFSFQQEKPEEWVRAKQSENARNLDDTGFVLRYANAEQPKSGIWMTATALPDIGQDKSKMPILMFSCFDNISRVELVLPKPTPAGVVKVVTASSFSISQRWLSDDSGNILRAGRGLPSIEVMKSLLSGPRAVVRSNEPEVGNLTFDTSGLKQAIQPMRNVCRW